MPVATTVIALAVGLGLFLIGLKQRRKLHASLSWPQVSGTILTARIDQSESGNSEDGYSTSYTPHIDYRYEVGGAPYTGSRLALAARSFPNARQAQQQLAPYAPGSGVAVYFDPNHPADAVLVRQAPGNSFLLWAGAAILILVVAALFR